MYYIKEVFRGVKVKLYPTKEQIEYFELCVKARNFSYNWGLEIWEKHYKETKTNIGMYSLNSIFNKYKKLEENKWLYLVCSKVCSLTFKDLENAYHKFFKGFKNKPTLKTDRSKKSFPVRLDNITITDKYIKISKKKYLKYKCENNGIEYIEVDKNYSATQRCSKCGNIKVGDKKLSINHRTYKCDVCGLEIDRDFNASINLKNYTT